MACSCESPGVPRVAAIPLGGSSGAGNLGKRVGSEGEHQPWGQGLNLPLGTCRKALEGLKRSGPKSHVPLGYGCMDGSKEVSCVSPESLIHDQGMQGWAVTCAFSRDSAGWRQEGALTGLQGCGELEAQGLSLGVEGRADSRGPQVLHQLGLGAAGRVVLDAVVAVQGHRKAVL